MNFVMNAEFAVPSAREIKVMMNVMEHPVKEEPSRKSGEETENVGNFEVNAENKPHYYKKACCEKPGHANESLRFFMMKLVASVGECRATMINPAMEAVLKQSPANQTARISGEEKENVGVEYDEIPEQEQECRERIAEKTNVVVGFVRGNSVQKRTRGRRYLFTVGSRGH